MAARGGRNNIVARRVIDDLIDISGERSPLKYLKIFIEQQITDHRRFIARMRDEIRTSTNLISQLNALIAELEASGDYEEVFDLVMELQDDRRDEQDKVADFNRLIAVAEEKIHGKEIDLEILLVGSLNGMEWNVMFMVLLYIIFVVNGIMSGYEALSFECEAPLCLSVVAVGCAIGYIQSGEVFDEVLEDDENNHLNGNVVKRGITRLYKFRREYGKPDGIKLIVTFDALNRIPGKHRALFSSFLGYMVVAFIGFEDSYLKTVDSGKQEINYGMKINVCLSAYNGMRWIRTVKEKMIEKKEIEPNEEPARGTLWLKGRVNKDEEYPDDEIRSVGDKLKETEDKIKEATLKVDHGIDAMTVVLGKEKGGYARGVGSGVTYKRYFDLPRCRQASNERILLLQSQLDNERHELDAACIPDVGNNGFKTVKDAVGGFFAWSKDQVVFDPKATPRSTIQMNVENKTAPKLQTKRKNVYVFSDAMQRQAKKKSLQKTLNY
ncbi:hypothetical protein Tco_0668475 [Tanacetum coccineum]